MHRQPVLGADSGGGINPLRTHYQCVFEKAALTRKAGRADKHRCIKTCVAKGWKGAGDMRMPKETIDREMFAPCGMNCTVCYKHVAHKNSCAGCLKNDNGKPGHCRLCKIKDCVQGKKLRYCYVCPNYPCPRLKNLERSYNVRYRASLVENGLFVKLNGLDAFMELQKEKYACPRCGGIITVHDRVCSECKK